VGRVSGKVALVTGGASGIGEACARLLAKEGAAVAMVDIDKAAGETLARKIEAAGGKALFLAFDVTREDDWVKHIAIVKARFGRLDIAVNAAGTNIARSFPTETPLDEWRRLISINLDGVFLATKHCLAAMQASDPVNGSIVNISSMLGLVGAIDIAAYCASKGGVRLYTKSVALSCGERKVRVRVNSIHPGYIDTPLLRKSLTPRFPSQEEGIRALEAVTPGGRIGTPDDIAYAALYLASDESKFVTGAELVIDGGYTAR
jgi:NAD(P)-dependent dehydrogenase (short-subunit alcohol dehydrogenase family)